MGNPSLLAMYSALFKKDEPKFKLVANKDPVLSFLDDR